jgi:ribonuclease D
MTDESLPILQIPMDKIKVVRSGTDAKSAREFILASDTIVGFDTETRIVFKGPAPADGPHIVQLSTLEKTFVFQMHVSECHKVVSEVVADPLITKVGFGLKNDMRGLRRLLNIQPLSMVDIGRLPGLKNGPNCAGLKTSVEKVLGMSIDKSRCAMKSNWARETLSDSQVMYAANDAWASLLVYNRLVGRSC